MARGSRPFQHVRSTSARIGTLLGGVVSDTFARVAAVSCGVGLTLAASCSPSTAANPFQDGRDATEVDAGAADASTKLDETLIDDQSGETEAPRDPTLGLSCKDDGQCDDEIPCTHDACDLTLERCRHSPDASSCLDDSFCNGVEECVPGLGCRPGAAVVCDDGSACSISRCDEAEAKCVHEVRDADGDGDPDWHCQGGSDCDDTNPRVSGSVFELCGNGVDDNCDGEVDEAFCGPATADRCTDPLLISESGRYDLTGVVLVPDYVASCTREGLWDAAVRLRVEDGPVDVELRVDAATGALALASYGECGVLDSESACDTSLRNGELRTLLRGLSSGEHDVVVFAETTAGLDVSVKYRAPTTPPQNVTCSAALELELGEPVEVDLWTTTETLASRCAAATGSLVYRLVLDEPSDLLVTANSREAAIGTAISLRGPACTETDGEAEVGCSGLGTSPLLARALPAGEYFIAVSAEQHTTADLVVERRSPTEAPAYETCDAAAPAGDARTLLDFSEYTDEATPDCLPGAPDAALGYSVSSPEDVLWVARASAGDRVALSLASDCEFMSESGCAESVGAPLRLRRHALAAGDYQLLVESEHRLPVEVTRWSRRATAAVFVSGADDCDDVVVIPAGGGFFQGNTAMARADFSAGCDVASESAGGARDQILSLTLPEPRRVVFDMQGSGYRTLLNLREGGSCPGRPVSAACLPGLGADRSYLDLQLEAGVYYVQVDGYGGEVGEWFLDVFVGPP